MTSKFHCHYYYQYTCFACKIADRKEWEEQEEEQEEEGQGEEEKEEQEERDPCCHSTCLQPQRVARTFFDTSSPDPSGMTVQQ